VREYRRDSVEFVSRRDASSEAGQARRLLRQAARYIPAGALKPFGRPVVLGFHGVASCVADARVEVSHHERDHFYAIAKSLRARFQVLPLQALEDVRRHPSRHSRTVFLTSDDGYANTLTLAADILEELRLPWSLFVTTHHIETGEPNPLFVARLFFFFGPAGSYEIPHLANPVVLGNDRSATAARTIAALKLLDVEKAREAVAAMAQGLSSSKLNELVLKFPSERYLAWDDIAALARRGVEIGAHAHWHWPMNAAQAAATIAEQAERPRALIAAHLGHCRYFAYPFGNMGDVSRAAWYAVRDAGYAAAFTTKSATLDAATNDWLLPRYALELRESRLDSLLPLLRFGNSRLRSWQHALD
jgi:peptidoglycan/xylan/chitin deacetylase (PgdA/CDA1 family)